MKLQKAIDSEKNTYFAFHIIKDSREMEIIRTFPVRFWNIQNKVWLIPYSIANWVMIKQKFEGIDIYISNDILHMNDGIAVSNHTTKATATRCVALNAEQQKAYNQMKQQLILKRYQASTLKNYLSYFAEFLRYHKNKKPNDITQEEIRAFILYKISENKISESTQNSLINAIKFYFEKVEGREKFHLYDLRPRQARKLPGFLSKEETIKLLKTTENLKHRAILQLIYSAGLRLGELTRLKIRDIKFDCGVIEVKCAKGKKDRITVLSMTVKKLLLEYIEMYKPKYYLFEGQTGGKYSDRSVQNIMQQAVIKSGVDENATVHTLRHSFATHMIMDGVDIRIVQEYLGHSSPETTAIYTHITDKMKKEIKSPLDNLDM